MRRWSTLALLLVGLPALADPIKHSQETAVYFLAVGSSHYAKAPPGLHGFKRLIGASKSARLIAERLHAGGAAFGLLLTSDQDALVTTADVNSAVERLVAKIQSDHAKHPLMLIYYAGHGVSEGVGWNHFSVPGDFVYADTLASHGIEGLAASTTYAGALVTSLNKAGVPYTLILDTCYEGKAASFQSEVLTGPAIESLSATATILRYMNEFHQGNPVIFSTPPGTLVSTVDDPTDPIGDPVAPLARRLLLILDPRLKAHRSITLGELLKEIKDPTLDGKTQPGISFADQGASLHLDVIGSAPASPPPIKILGTGTAAHPCCATPPSATPAPRAFVGQIEITGTPGDFITQGQHLILTTPTYAFTATDTPGDLALSIAHDVNDDDWDVDLSMPASQPFKPAAFGKVDRYGFSAPGHPGIAIFGQGRACNDLTGKLHVANASFDPGGRLSRLVADIDQRCDAGHGALHAKIDIHALSSSASHSTGP